MRYFEFFLSEKKNTFFISNLKIKRKKKIKFSTNVENKQKSDFKLRFLNKTY